MKKFLSAGFAGVSALVLSGAAMAQTYSTDPVGSMLTQIDTTSMKEDIGLFGVAAIGVFLTLAAIGLAKALLKKTTSN